MNRNPVNILNDLISKAAEMATLAIRLVIMVNRANKLLKIDLRKYRGRPEKKQQIRRMILALGMKTAALNSQMRIIMSQPIQTIVFERGTTIEAHTIKGEEIIINHDR